jgi:hypothetical protein
VARLLVRGAFYLVMLLLVLVILVLLRENDPALDVYALAERLRAMWPGGG